MKKVMDQSKVINLLNGISLVSLAAVVILLGVCIASSLQLEKASEDRYDLTYNANRFMDGSSYLTEEVRAYAATGNQQYYDNYMNEVNVLQNREKGLAGMQAIGITNAEQSMIDTMSSLSNQLVPLEEDALENAHQGRITQALNYVYGAEYTATVGRINDLRDQFLATLNDRTQAEVDRLETRLFVINILCVAALVLAAAMQVMTMAFTKKQILKPVLLVRDQMGEIARGNLSAPFPLEPDTSEIGRLVESIHNTKRELQTYINDIDKTLSQMAKGKMDIEVRDDYVGDFLPIQKAMSQILDSLNATLSQINRTASRVSDESMRMASDAQVLADGAAEQASTVEELSASILDLSGQVNQTSSDADSAWNCSNSTEAQLRACSQKMEELTAAMGDISESSRQINGIIQTIENISFQTNILALNAAVEAARAGAAGKGFAVVANEVQSLANKSAAAAMDITKLIKNSLQQIEQGAALSVDTTTALAAGVSRAEESMELVKRIAGSAKEQSLALSQLTGGMEQISGVIQTTAATAETSASSAQELQSEAMELRESVQLFQLRR